jgi:hypothetical protein
MEEVLTSNSQLLDKEVNKMKRITKLIFVLTLSFLLIPSQLVGQTKKLGQTGMKFLGIGMGARATAMGEAFTVVGNDANALFYNPAGIAEMNSKIDIIVSITDWIADISYNALGLAFNGGIWGNLGISFISADYGNVPGTRVAPTEEGFEETGQLDIGAFALGLSYARMITDRFGIGGQLNYASQHLGSNLVPTLDFYGNITGTTVKENKTSGLSFDLGTFFYPGWESFRFGVSITNFSPEYTYEEESFQLPLTYSLGVAMDILDFFGDHPKNSMLLAVDAVDPRDYNQRIHLGLEYSYNNMMFVRTGYKFNYDEAGLTLGVGFYLEGVKIDYSYGDFGEFEMVNRVSLGMAF